MHKTCYMSMDIEIQNPRSYLPFSSCHGFYDINGIHHPRCSCCSYAICNEESCDFFCKASRHRPFGAPYYNGCYQTLKHTRNIRRVNKFGSTR